MKKSNIALLLVSIVVIAISYCYLCTYKNHNIVKYGEKDVDLSIELISSIIKKNAAKIEEAEYLAIDSNSFNIISEKDKSGLIAGIKNHKNSIILASYNILNDPSLMKDDVLKGVLVSASNFKRNANKISGEISLYKSSLDMVGYSFKATYKYGRWHVKYSNKSVS